MTSKTYTWDGQTASATDNIGNTTTYTYDARGNQSKETDALGNITYQTHDRMGRVTEVVSPKNYIENATLTDLERTKFSYDAMGRVLKQTEVYQKMILNGSYEWEKQW